MPTMYKQTDNSEWREKHQIKVKNTTAHGHDDDV